MCSSDLRWFLKHYSNVGEVGIYSLGYRFGEILSFVVTAFQLSWPQFVFSHRKQEDAPQLFAQMTSYWVALLFFMWLGLSVAAPELLRIMATPAYYGAAAVVPVIAFAQALDSGRFIFGPEVEGFEREAAAYLGVEQAVGVANGTDAIVLALEIGRAHV